VTLASLALDKHYGKTKTLALDLASALSEEVRALVRAGASNVQIDEPILTQHPEDLPVAVEALDRIHSEKGSSRLTLFTFFGAVTKIYLDLLDAPTDVIGFDLVQGAATWSSIAKHGSKKPLVLGVVDARNTKREDAGTLAKKVSELTGAVDLKASYLSPSNGLEFLPRDRAREKLRILSSAAKKTGVGG
jgi:5-methyltetrahydropteroyltriglutamate--homocysteine methyltransferase